MVGMAKTGNFACRIDNPYVPCTSCGEKIPDHAIAISNQDSACPFICEIGYVKQWSNAKMICKSRRPTRLTSIPSESLVSTPLPSSTAPTSNITIIAVPNKPVRYPVISDAATFCQAPRKANMFLRTILIFFVIYQVLCRVD